ncbi:MAG: FAD-dependent oxidoreductase, partial [Planctomycetes bacterium]|nr:FAD-dependent oxidoreductase [Planctomycetota bacterium]
WDSGRVWTTDEATTATELPESVVIVGGGVIGCEFATAYAELGIPVTVVEMLDRLLATIDEDAARGIVRSLKKRGITIHTGRRIVGMKASKKGVAAELEGGGTVEAARALVAVGRAPNVENIGLEKVGVRLDGKVIQVDDRCRTSVEGIYAIGDVATRLQYAHLASRMGVVAADNATGHASRDPRTVVPVGVYSHPEVAAVGLSEAEARAAGKDVRVARFSYQASGMARAYGETEGQVKLIAETKHGEILGAMVIGHHATDVVQEIALAMKNELTVEEVASTIHPHPTFVEGVLEAAEAWLGFPIHTSG